MKNFFKNVYEKFKDAFLYLKDFYFYEEAGKTRMKSRKVKIQVAVTTALGFLIQLCTSHDDSVLGKSYKPFFITKKENGVHVTQSQRAKSVIDAHEEDARNSAATSKRVRGIKLNYNAKQVIARDSNSSDFSTLPSGTNFIGKLLTGIDTRSQSQSVRVILPYGASHSSGGLIPRNSILLGSISYPGKGERVYLNFNRVIFPSGSEYKMDAQALSSADYTPGLIGEATSQSDLRLAGSIGLTAVSAVAEVLSSRTAAVGINQLGQVVAEQANPSLKDAALKGISQASKEEASRHAEVAKNSEEYLTLNAGADLIVSLLAPFTGEN